MDTPVVRYTVCWTDVQHLGRKVTSNDLLAVNAVLNQSMPVTLLIWSAYQNRFNVAFKVFNPMIL